MTGNADGVGRYQLAGVLGVSEGMIIRAFELDLLPGPDRGGRWSPAAAAELRTRWPQIATAITQAEELGAVRCAELLSRVTGLPVNAADITELAALGILRATRRWMRRPLYRVADVHALADDLLGSAQVAAVVAARQGRGRVGARMKGMTAVPGSHRRARRWAAAATFASVRTIISATLSTRW